MNPCKNIHTNTFRLSSRVICDWLDTPLYVPMLLRWCDIPISTSTVIGHDPGTRRFKITGGEDCGWKKWATLWRKHDTLFQVGWWKKKHWTTAYNKVCIRCKSMKTALQWQHPVKYLHTHIKPSLSTLTVISPRFSIVKNIYIFFISVQLKESMYFIFKFKFSRNTLEFSQMLLVLQKMAFAKIKQQSKHNLLFKDTYCTKT